MKKTGEAFAQLLSGTNLIHHSNHDRHCQMVVIVNFFGLIKSGLL